MVDNIVKSAVTVMTRGDENRGPFGLGGKKLLGFYPIAGNPRVLEWRTTVDDAPPAPQQ